MSRALILLLLLYCWECCRVEMRCISGPLPCTSKAHHRPTHRCIWIHMTTLWFWNLTSNLKGATHIGFRQCAASTNRWHPIYRGLKLRYLLYFLWPVPTLSSFEVMFSVTEWLRCAKWQPWANSRNRTNSSLFLALEIYEAKPAPLKLFLAKDPDGSSVQPCAALKSSAAPDVWCKNVGDRV